MSIAMGEPREKVRASFVEVSFRCAFCLWGVFLWGKVEKGVDWKERECKREFTREFEVWIENQPLILCGGCYGELENDSTSWEAA